MKREDITAVFPDATKEQIDKLMGINGEDINKAKGDLDNVKTQLAEAQAALKKPQDDGKLQEAQEQAAAYKAELDSLKLANGLREMREKVAAEKKIPVSLLTADTEEACKAQADSILAFAQPGSYPNLPNPGEQGGSSGVSTRDQFAKWSENII